MQVHKVNFLQTASSFFSCWFETSPKLSLRNNQHLWLREWLFLIYSHLTLLGTITARWGTPGSRVKTPSDKPVTYLVWCQRGDAALNWKAEQCAWRGRLITCQASCSLPRGIKHYKRGWEATLISYPRKMAIVVCLEGPALLTWTAWMDDVCELPAGAAGFTDTGQDWFLNGPDGFLMALEWRRDQKV